MDSTASTVPAPIITTEHRKFINEFQSEDQKVAVAAGLVARQARCPAEKGQPPSPQVINQLRTKIHNLQRDDLQKYTDREAGVAKTSSAAIRAALLQTPQEQEMEQRRREFDKKHPASEKRDRSGSVGSSVDKPQPKVSPPVNLPDFSKELAAARLAKANKLKEQEVDPERPDDNSDSGSRADKLVNAAGDGDANSARSHSEKSSDRSGSSLGEDGDKDISDNEKAGRRRRDHANDSSAPGEKKEPPKNNSIDGPSDKSKTDEAVTNSSWGTQVYVIGAVAAIALAVSGLAYMNRANIQNWLNRRK